MPPKPVRCSVCKISVAWLVWQELIDGDYICQICAVREVKRLQGQLEEVRKALLAYSNDIDATCPGVLMQAGLVSGCGGHAPNCPTCTAVAAAENE